MTLREGYEAKEVKGKGKEKGGNQRASGGGGGATGPYVTRVMDDAREDEMEVLSSVMSWSRLIVLTACATIP